MHNEVGPVSWQPSVVEEPCYPMLVDSSDSNTIPVLQCEIPFDDEKIRLEIRLLDLQCDELAIENEKQKLDVEQQKNDIKISGIDGVMKFQAALTSLDSWRQDRRLMLQTQEVLKNCFFGKSLDMCI